MKRLLNNIGIPNVVTHSLTDPTYNVVALLYEKLVKERKFKTNQITSKNKSANKYLGKSFRRLRQYARDGELGKFNFLAQKLLSSYSLQVQAYNSVFPKWIILKTSTVKKHLKYLRKLCYTQETNIDYKRVWIDKKPGDFARPLGVPTIVWRVYLRILTNLGEVYADGQNLYSDFQHGGRPGSGVMTCLEELANKIKDADRIFEFDLKGFFDHIRKDSVKEFFKGTFLGELYYNLLHSKPKSFKLPPEEKDVVKQQVEGIKEKLKTLDNILFGQSYDYAIQEIEEKQIMIKKVIQKMLNLKEQLGKGEFEGAGIKIITEGMLLTDELNRLYGDVNEAQHIIDTHGDMDIFREFSNSIMTEEQRESNRDAWKSLDLPEQGIPQGTSFGPFLASTIVAWHLRGIPNLLMYIDDGMIFLKENETAPIAKLESLIAKIGVELAPNKSKMLSTSDLVSSGIKFLGVRTRKNLESKVLENINHLGAKVREYSTMTSETRRGIVKNFREISKENYKDVLEKMFDKGLITISKFRLLMYYLKVEKSRLGEFLSKESIHIAIKFGFFGNLLAEAYDPGNTPEDLKRKIKEGMEMAEKRVRKSNKSLGKLIIGKRLWAFEGMNGTEECVPNLFNLSTLACNILLEIGVDFLFIKSIKAKKAKPSKQRVIDTIKQPDNWEVIWVDYNDPRFKDNALKYREETRVENGESIKIGQVLISVKKSEGKV